MGISFGQVIPNLTLFGPMRSTLTQMSFPIRSRSCSFREMTNMIQSFEWGC